MTLTQKEYFNRLYSEHFGDISIIPFGSEDESDIYTALHCYTELKDEIGGFEGYMWKTYIYPIFWEYPKYGDFSDPNFWDKAPLTECAVNQMDYAIAVMMDVFLEFW